MAQYTYSRNINPSRLIQEIQAAGLSLIDRVDTDGANVLIYFNGDLSPSQKISLDGIVASHVAKTVKEIVQEKVDEAMAFGQTLMREFITDNVLLGISERGLTGHIRKALREVKDATETGSLKDAITEVKSLDPSDFDSVVLTPARLLAFRNKIEAWLQVPLADAWDDDETWL